MECVNKFVTFNAIAVGILLPIGCKYAVIVEMIYSKLKWTEWLLSIGFKYTIEGIEVDTGTFVTFDVFDKDEDDDPYVFDKEHPATSHLLLTPTTKVPTISEFDASIPLTD
ncbi:Hypothetical predicted protein [Olea europaea subsp. europaea]|uniref:Uncharacterized protein n=1 Tax=Olea europaea subsp. europaea TaxID=158383 RepID=A0A8S0T1C5_OLEEU|nr:Hypothetical predicted protein [Olea europaea subsp. europaea]